MDNNGTISNAVGFECSRNVLFIFSLRIVRMPYVNKKGVFLKFV